MVALSAPGWLLDRSLSGHRDALAFIRLCVATRPRLAYPARSTKAMQYKQPRSVQVVIFSETQGAREFLLLRRVASHGGFWQSVTGSLEEAETHLEAAVREVREETGIIVTAKQLIDLRLVNTFEIAPQWRTKYAPEVTHNEEVCFALRVDRCEVRIDSIEHDVWMWSDRDTAMKMLYWESNKRALTSLEDCLRG